MDRLLRTRTISAFLRNWFSESQIAQLKPSLREFAKKTGASPSTISNILNGKRGVSPRMVRKLAKEMGLDPKSLRHFYLLQKLSEAREEEERILIRRKILENAGKPEIRLESRFFVELTDLELQLFHDEFSELVKHVNLPKTNAVQPRKKIMISLQMRDLPLGDAAEIAEKSDSPSRESAEYLPHRAANA